MNSHASCPYVSIPSIEARAIAELVDRFLPVYPFPCSHPAVVSAVGAVCAALPTKGLMCTALGIGGCGSRPLTPFVDGISLNA